MYVTEPSSWVTILPPFLIQLLQLGGYFQAPPAGLTRTPSPEISANFSNSAFGTTGAFVPAAPAASATFAASPASATLSAVFRASAPSPILPTVVAVSPTLPVAFAISPTLPAILPASP